MRKIIGIVILIIMITGCSNTKQSAYNTKTQSNKNTSFSSASTVNIQTQQPSINNSKNINNDDSNTDSSLTDNIDTTKSLFEEGYYDYQGTIGNNMSIQMSIYPLKTDIIGSYFYDSKLTEIKLKGKAGEKDIILYEYDKDGKNTGIFKGTMSTVDKIEGTWVSADAKRSYPFTLSLKSIIFSSQYGKRYGMAVGTESDQDVENYVIKIQNYIKNDNKKQLSELIAYPINVKIDNKVTKIKDEDEFIKYYKQIFNPQFKQIMSNAYTKYLFTNYQGIMFGGNVCNVWINEYDSKLMITTINN